MFLVKKVFSFVLAVIMMFTACTATSFAADTSTDDEYGVAPCFTNVSSCSSGLVCTDFIATMTVRIYRNSNVTKTVVNVNLLKYTSDGWESVYSVTKYDYDTGLVDYTFTHLISPFPDYCMKMVAQVYTATNVETITQYRYS